VVGFHGASVAEVRARSRMPLKIIWKPAARPPASQKPYSGKLMLRLPPEVHARAAMMAAAHGKSLNQWAAEVLANAR